MSVYTDDQVVRIRDLTEIAVLDVDKAMAAEYEERNRQAWAYAEHLRNGGDPSAANKHTGPFTLLSSTQVAAIDAARRVALGLPPNPFVPGQFSYRLFDYLWERRGEFTPVAQITNDVRLYAYSSSSTYVVEKAIHQHSLREAGWELVKGKVNGKVAYKMQEVEEQHGSS